MSKSPVTCPQLYILSYKLEKWPTCSRQMSISPRLFAQVANRRGLTPGRLALFPLSSCNPPDLLGSHTSLPGSTAVCLRASRVDDVVPENDCGRSRPNRAASRNGGPSAPARHETRPGAA